MTPLEVGLSTIVAILIISHLLRPRKVRAHLSEWRQPTQAGNFGLSTTPAAAGCLHVRCGPMFCGKTTWLLEEMARNADLFNQKPLLINSIKDTRGDDRITSHNSQFLGLSSKITAMKTSRLANVDVTNYAVIGVDEAQFYPDLAITVAKWVAEGKQVYCAGLDGDFEMKSFGQINQLLALADSFMKLTAVCDKCLQLAPRPVTLTNLTRAPFSVRLIGSTKQTDVGGADKYVASCRGHFSIPVRHIV